jgi:hypothetical protein
MWNKKGISPMQSFFERVLIGCVLLLALDALGFSVASIFVADEDRQRVVNYGILIGIGLVGFMMIMFIFALIASQHKED